MTLPKNKTKIVCTIGKASRSEKMLARLIRSGLNVARLNFAHGNIEEHRENIKRIRKVSKELGKVVAILADLPGPKIRVGKILNEPMKLKLDQTVTVVPGEQSSNSNEIPCTYKALVKSVKKGHTIFLNDGFLQLKVVSVEGHRVHCKVVVGGLLFSHKGINIPAAEMSAQAVGKRDLEFLEFGLKEGIDAFSVSFVKDASDIQKVRRFAAKRGKDIFIVAKIERSIAVKNCSSILAETDAVMVARGDLGVEIPLEQVPAVQKDLILRANLASKPVITATQMLESMIDHIRPTRAETTDVANAILDGTDAIMLSAETAVGSHPVEAVKTMSRIAAYTEKMSHARDRAFYVRDQWRNLSERDDTSVKDMIALDAAETVRRLKVRHIVTPTDGGDTPRRISRFKPDCWILAFTPHIKVKRRLAFSYGVMPIKMDKPAEGWDRKIIAALKKQGLAKRHDRLISTEGAPVGQPTGTNSLKIITLE